MEKPANDEISAEIRLTFRVFLLMETFVFFATLAAMALPKSAFFGGMLFAMVGIAVGCSLVSAGLFAVVAAIHPMPKTLLFALVLQVIAIAEWLVFSQPYPTNLSAMHAISFELFVAWCLIPTTWIEYILVYRIFRLKMQLPRR